MHPTTDCGLEYSRVHFGPIVPSSGKQGWDPNVLYGIRVYGQGTATGLRLHMNLFSGPCDQSVYLNGLFDSEISDNVFENVGGDCIHMGWGSRVKFLRNWGSRAYYPRWEVNGGWYHSDFIQINAQNTTCEDLVYHGNVQMFGPAGVQGPPLQAIFASKSHGKGWDYEGNIICSNSVHGLSCGPSGQFTDTRARKNTVLRCIDAPGNQHSVQVMLAGAVELNWNVQCALAGNRGMGANGINIVMRDSDHTASLAYYTAPYRDSSFYDLRPVEGQPTHWNYSGGQPVGAYERFRDVILHGAYPKIGPAAAAWKAWYDPKNQITS
jgi:hypothetical protein